MPKFVNLRDILCGDCDGKVVTVEAKFSLNEDFVTVDTAHFSYGGKLIQDKKELNVQSADGVEPLMAAEHIGFYRFANAKNRPVRVTGKVIYEKREGRSLDVHQVEFEGVKTEKYVPDED